MILKWFQSKICLNWSQNVSTDKIWGQLGHWVEFYGGPKTLILSNFWAFSRFLTPLKPPTQYPIDPKFFLWTLFDFNSSIFYFQIISRSFKTEKSQFSHIDTLYEAKFCWNRFIKLSDPLVAQFKRFLRSECTKGSRIPKYLPWRGGICGLIIFAK